MTPARSTEDDLEDIIDIATVFNDKYGDMPLNPDKARTSLRHFIQEGVVFNTPLGAIVGIILEDPFRDVTTLLEIGWYAEAQGRSGLALLKAFIEEGRNQGVDSIVLSTLTQSDPRVNTLLERMGFKETETAFTLTL